MSSLKIPKSAWLIPPKVDFQHHQFKATFNTCLAVSKSTTEIILRLTELTAFHR